MADNTTLPGTGDVIATDDVSGVKYQRVKLVDGTLDSTAAIGGDATNGLDVDVTRLPALVAGTANIGDVDVLTVPAPLSTTGGGTEATAHRVTIANDSTGVLSVDDNGGSLTVDGTFWQATQPVSGTVTATPTGTYTTSDTATQVDDAAFTPATGRVLMVGATFDDVSPDSVNEGDGGAIRMSANRNAYTTLRDAAGNERGANVSAGNALLVDASATTQPVSGTVTANAGTGTLAVSNTVLSVVGTGTEATAQRVTIATDSTGVLSVDDNGGSLTVDGTVAATQSGTWTVQPGNTANTTAWKVDGSAVTQPVSGTVTANGGTPSGASSATVTDDTSVTTTEENIASNAARRGFIVAAPGTNTAVCYIKFGSTVSGTSYTAELPPGSYWEMPANVYTGAVYFQSETGTQTLHITEW